MAQFDRLPPSERDYWIADWQLNRLTCDDCGNPIDKCSDPERLWYPNRRICHATRERIAAEEAFTELHADAGWHDGTYTSWAKDRSDGHPYPALAGMTINVAERDMSPWDKFTTERDASPIKSVVEQPPGDEAEADD